MDFIYADAEVRGAKSERGDIGMFTCSHGLDDRRLETMGLFGHRMSVSLVSWWKCLLVVVSC